MSGPVFTVRFYLQQQDHLAAWQILQGVPRGRRNDFVICALCHHSESGSPKVAAADTRQEPEPTVNLLGEVPGDMLDYIGSLLSDS